MLSTTGSLAVTLGYYNPLRYRGYYYDVETGLYYLQSRYYDPETGRFLNADSGIDIIARNLGYNLFTYTSNNPINYYDTTGHGFFADLFKSTVKFIASNIVKPIVDTIKNVTSKIDLTLSMGPEFNISTIVLAFSLKSSIAVDTKGNIAIQSTTTIGATTTDMSLSVGRFVSLNNARDVTELQNDTVSFDGTVSAIIPEILVPLYEGKSVDIISNSYDKTPYFGFTDHMGIPLNMSGPWGLTLSGSTSFTKNICVFNIYDALDSLYISIMEW